MTPAALARIAAAVRGVAGEDGAPLFRDVLGALEAAALETWPRTPAAFVILLADEFEAAQGGPGAALQRARTTIGVQILLAAPDDASGAAALDPLREALGRTRAALAGLRSEGGGAALRLIDGRLAGIADGRVEWRDRYGVDWWRGGSGDGG